MTTRAEYIPLIDSTFLIPGSLWPPPSEAFRLNLITYNRALYQNNHTTMLNTLLNVIYKDPEENNDVIGVSINLYRALSKLWGDLLFGEIPQIKSDGNDDPVLTEITKETQFWVTARKVAVDVSRYGTGLFKVYLRQGLPVIEAIRPDIWFPVVNPDNINEELMHIIGYKVQEVDLGKGILFSQVKIYQYLKVEIHTKGKIEHLLYDLGNSHAMVGDNGRIGELVPLGTVARYKGLPSVEMTGLDDFCVIAVHNERDSEAIIGYDDYTDIEPVISRIEAHITKYGRDLEQQGNIKYGPAAAMDENNRLKMNGYIPVPYADTPIPGAITWEVPGDVIKVYLDQLMYYFYIISETNPALIHPDFTSGIGNLSGVALKRLIQRTLLKVNRLREAFDPAIKRILNAAAQLSNKTIPEFDIAWKDGLVDDITEKAQGVSLAITAGVMSHKTGTSIVQDIEGDALDEEMKQIEEEQQKALQVDPNFLKIGADNGSNNSGNNNSSNSGNNKNNKGK